MSKIIKLDLIIINETLKVMYCNLDKLTFCILRLTNLILFDHNLFVTLQQTLIYNAKWRMIIKNFDLKERLIKTRISNQDSYHFKLIKIRLILYSINNVGLWIRKSVDLMQFK